MDERERVGELCYVNVFAGIGGKNFGDEGWEAI